MILETFPVASAMQLHILGDEEAGEAIVIDPGDEVGRIHRRLAALASSSSRFWSRTPTSITWAARSSSTPHRRAHPAQPERPALLKMMEMQAGWLGVETPETAPPTPTWPRPRCRP